MKAQENKPAFLLRQIFFAVCFIRYGYTAVRVLFFNTAFDYSFTATVVAAVVWLGVVYGVFRLLDLNEKHMDSKPLHCLAVFFILLTITQLIIWFVCGCYPTRDFYNVYIAAYNYTISGQIVDPYLDYLYKFPNNLPITVVLQFLFRAFYRLGITNFPAVGTLFNVACIDLAYLFVFLCVDKLKGRRAAFLSLFIMFFNLPLQTYLTYYYTDTTTMLYPPMLIYFCILLKEKTGKVFRLAIIALVGIATGFGMQLKLSVAIAVIAVSVDMLLNADFKKLIAVIAAVVTGFNLWGALFNGFVYSTIMDKDLADDKATPFIAWIAMGLQGDGTHSADDNYYIWSFETKEEKISAAENLLKARLKEYGITGYIGFLQKKHLRSFGSGLLDIYRITGEYPMHENFTNQFLCKGGKYVPVFESISQGYYILLLAGVARLSAISFRKKDHRRFTPLLCLFGLMLFLLLWEAGPRYLLNYMAVFSISAAIAYDNLFSYKTKRTTINI